MTLTEDEAKTKRCQESYGPPATPMQMAYSMGAGIAAYTAPLNCLGSGCMAWRWATPQAVYKYNQPTGDVIVKGYCGKAGRPVA